jgi:ankyrin repeat protein
LDPDNFNNRKRADRFVRVAKMIYERALAEATSLVGNEDPLPANLPEGMNLLHLAALSGNLDVVKILLGRLSGASRSGIVEMLSQKVLAETFPSFKFDDLVPVTPLEIAESKRSFEVAIEFARLVGIETKIGGTVIAKTLCDMVNPYANSNGPAQIEELFEIGLDPNAKIDGMSIQELFRSSAMNANSYRPLDVRDRHLALIDEAFIKAISSRKEKPDTKNDPPIRQQRRDTI